MQITGVDEDVTEEFIVKRLHELVEGQLLGGWW